jgi:hypothetical protein
VLIVPVLLGLGGFQLGGERMNQGFFEIDIHCHNYPEDYATAKIIAIPEVDYLRYTLPDKPDEVYSAEEFKTLLEDIKFKRSPEIVIFVVNKNSRKRAALRFPLSWPDELTPGTKTSRFGLNFTIPE